MWVCGDAGQRSIGENTPATACNDVRCSSPIPLPLHPCGHPQPHLDFVGVGVSGADVLCHCLEGGAAGGHQLSQHGTDLWEERATKMMG